MGLWTRLFMGRSINRPPKGSRRVCTRCQREWNWASMFRPQLRGDGWSELCTICLGDDGGVARGLGQQTLAPLDIARGIAERLVKGGRAYGRTQEELVAQLIAQKLKCRICYAKFSVKSRLCHDHMHVTARSRGFLCNRCNLLLGHAEDKESILESAIEYLRESEKVEDDTAS